MLNACLKKSKTEFCKEALHFTPNCYIQQALNWQQEHMTAGNTFKMWSLVNTKDS